MTVGIEVSLGWVGKGQWCDGVKANSRFRHVISQTSMLTWIRINKRRLKGCTCVRACVCVCTYYSPKKHVDPSNGRWKLCLN